MAEPGASWWPASCLRYTGNGTPFTSLAPLPAGRARGAHASEARRCGPGDQAARPDLGMCQLPARARGDRARGEVESAGETSPPADTGTHDRECDEVRERDDALINAGVERRPYRVSRAR